jgi:hypothetical protein
MRRWRERIRVLQDPEQGGDRAYGAPRITSDLNDGVAVAERINRKRVVRVMREHQLAGIAAAPAGEDDDPGPIWAPLPRPDSAGLHRRRAEPKMRGRHHWAAAGISDSGPS